MRKIVMQKMGKIAAVSMMSAIVSISFNGCGFFSSSIGEIRAESCRGEGTVTARGQLIIDENNPHKKTDTREMGECKGGVREGLWKYYNANDSSIILQEVNFVGGIRNGVTKKDAKMQYDHSSRKSVINYETIEYYSNGKKMGERKDRYFYLYEEDTKTSTKQFIRLRKYDIALYDHKRAYDEKVSEIERKNSQIERENNEMQYQARQQYEEAKAKAQETAQKRAESKVKKPTMQEVKKSKSVMDTYRAKLQAQVEKELQIELSKIQTPQVIQKQTQAIPQYKAPKLDTYEEILAFVKDKKYIIEERFSHKRKYNGYTKDDTINMSQDSDGNNFKGKISTNELYCTIENDTYKGKNCGYLRHNTFFWDKTIFKDKLNAILP